MTAPAAARRGNSSRKTSVPSTMISTGVVALKIAPLVASVYCRPQYCRTLCSPPPSSPSATIGRHSRASSRRADHRRGPTNGMSSATAIAQRQNVSADGGTRSASMRPATQLPVQNRAASVRSEYASVGFSWDMARRYPEPEIRLPAARAASNLLSITGRAHVRRLRDDDGRHRRDDDPRAARRQRPAAAPPARQSADLGDVAQGGAAPRRAFHRRRRPICAATARAASRRPHPTTPPTPSARWRSTRSR